MATMLAGFPDLTQSPAETAKSYMMALEGLPMECVSAAITGFHSGNVAGYNPAFRPSPPQIASEARRLRDLDLDRQNREKKLQAQIEAKPVTLSPAEIQRRKEFVDSQLGRIDLSFPEERRVRFTELPREQAIDDLEKLKKNTKRAVEVSPELIAKYGINAEGNNE